MKARLLRFVAAIIAVAALICPAASSAAQPFTINAILSLTGYAAFIGQQSELALQAATNLANRSGGIGGRPISLHVVDDGSNPATALQLANEIIAGGAPVIFGPALTSNCEAVFPRVLASGPVTYCLGPAVYPSAGSYGFSGGPSTRDLNVAGVRYFREKGWKRIALLTTTDASGQDGDREAAYALALPENKGMEVVAHEHFGVSDVSISAQAARLKAAHPDAILAWVTGTPTGTALRGLHDAGLDVPVMLNAGDIVEKQIASYSGFAPTTLLFTGFVFMAPQLPTNPQVRRAQELFTEGFKALGAPASTPAALVFDPARIVIEAFRHLGTDATAAQIKDYIEHVKHYPGIDGFMDYTNGSQRGIGVDGTLIVRWNPAKGTFDPVSRAGGSGPF